jgi:cobalt-zinc-cadmium efflux system protein
MSHHHHHHDHAEGNLLAAFALNFAFTGIEIIGGLWTNSVAILSDAVHDSGDCLALGLAWYLQRLAQRQPDARFTYGYRRLSSLGALITGVVLIGGLGFIGWEAIQRLRSPEDVKAPGIIGLAIVGVIFNGAAVLRLSGGRSLNEQMARWHLLEDTLGWMAVLVGGIAMALWKIPILDPLLALMIAVIVLWNVFWNLKKVAHIFLQGAPPGFDPVAFEKQLAELPHFVGCHHTNTWTLDGERHVFSTHLVLDANASRDDIVALKRRVHELLREHHFEHITLDVELAGERCAADQELGDDEHSCADHNHC